MHCGGGHSLGHRKDIEQRIAVDFPARVLIGKASPAVDHQFFTQIGGDLDADFALLCNGLIDGGLNRCIRLRIDSHCALPGRLKSKCSSGPCRATDRTTRPTKGNSARKLRRSEEHTSELQSLMRISYAVFFLKQKTT